MPSAELAGLPGVGKTTVFRTLVDELRHRDVGVRTPWDLGSGRRLRSLIHHASTAARSWRLLSLVVSLSIRQEQLRFSAFRSLRLLVLALEHQMQHRHPIGGGDILLLDEGVIQRGLKFLVARGFRAPRELVWEYIRRLPVLPDRLLVLETSPERALDRALGRPRGLPPRFQGLTRPQALRLFEDVAAVLQDSLDALAELRPGETAVCRLPMEPSVEQLLEAVSGGIAAHGAKASSPLREVSG